MQAQHKRLWPISVLCLHVCRHRLTVSLTPQVSVAAVTQVWAFSLSLFRTVRRAQGQVTAATGPCAHTHRHSHSHSQTLGQGGHCVNHVTKLSSTIHSSLSVCRLSPIQVAILRNLESSYHLHTSTTIRPYNLYAVFDNTSKISARWRLNFSQLISGSTF